MSMNQRIIRCAACDHPMRRGSAFCPNCKHRVDGSVLVEKADSPVLIVSPESDESSRLRRSAAISAWIFAFGLGLMSLIQLGLYAIADLGVGLLISGSWNALVAAAYIAIGFGITAKKRVAHDWGVWSGILNIIFISWLAYVGLVINVCFIPFNIALIVLLLLARWSLPKAAKSTT